MSSCMLSEMRSGKLRRAREVLHLYRSVTDLKHLNVNAMFCLPRGSIYFQS